MKNIFMFAVLGMLSIANLCYGFAGITGTKYIGYPTEIQTTNTGVNFMIKTSPSQIGFAEAVKGALNKIEITLSETYCEVLKIKNSNQQCMSSVPYSPVTKPSIGFIHLRLNHPNYLALLQLLTTSYLAQNLLEFDITVGEKLTPQSWPLEYDYELNAILLK